MHLGRGQAEQPRWNAAMHVNVLEPLHDCTLAILRWLEVVTCHYRVRAHHIIFVLWELLVLVVYEGVGVFALLRVVAPFLHFHEAVAL